MAGGRSAWATTKVLIRRRDTRFSAPTGRRASPVVVGAVSGEDGPQVPVPEDQDAVGDFGTDGQDEAFGEAVRPRTLQW